MISPNMSLLIPGVAVTDGPLWASQLNTSLTLIDAHDHSPGNGVQINPGGMDINSDLSFQNHNATSLRTANFSIQSTMPALGTDVGSLYTDSTDLFYIDRSGNNIQITQGGGIAGSPGSIANLTSPASASYVSGNSTFVWQSNAAVAANMDAGSILLRNITVSSFALTLSPPTLSSNYTVVLPTLPASQKIMTLDNSGNMAAPYVVDNSTIEINTNTIRVKASGITTSELADNSVTTAKILDANITPAKLSALGQQVSSSSGTFQTGSGSYVDVTNLTVTITTTGRPVELRLISDGSGNDSYIGINTTTNGSASASFSFVRDATTISEQTVRVDASYNTGVINSLTNFIPPSSLSHIDVGAIAGTYTYKVQVKRVLGAAANAFVFYNKLIAYEL